MLFKIMDTMSTLSGGHGAEVSATALSTKARLMVLIWSQKVL